MIQLLLDDTIFNDLSEVK